MATEAKSYNSSDRLEPLTRQRTHPTTLVDLLIDEAAAFLDDAFFEDEETKARVVNNILQLRYILREKFKKVLKDNNIWETVAGRLEWGSSWNSGKGFE